MEVETEVCPFEKSWFHKKESKFKDGKFLIPTGDEKFEPTTNTAKFLTFLDNIENK